MIRQLDKIFNEHTYLIFLCALAAWIGFTPFFDLVDMDEVFEMSMISIIDISAFYFFRRSQQKFLAFIIAPLAILLNILYHFFGDAFYFYTLERYVSLALFLMITVHLINHVVSSKDVDQETIFASAAGYIMLGLMFAILCRSFDGLWDNAYSGLTHDQGLMDHAYYAFITMSTLGYGDILPLIPATKSLAIFITLIGQFYMTVLIALLIGKFLHQLNSKE